LDTYCNWASSSSHSLSTLPFPFPAAFDPANSFAPTAATLVAFSSSFRKTIAALYGPSGLTVTVTNVTDALNGKTLYTLVRCQHCLLALMKHAA